MSHTLQIARRELGSFFLSPMAYIALVVFYSIFGLIFYFAKVSPDANAYATADMVALFFWTTLLLVLLAPVFTMGLIAEERRLGTLEGLLTAPVTHTALVVGKFVAAMGLYVVLLLPSAVHTYILFRYSSVGPDVWKLAAGYLGLLLLGAFMLSFGLMCSCLARAQTAAALVSIITLFLFWLLGFFMGETPPATLANDTREHVLQGLYRGAKFVAYGRHYDSFMTGALDLRDIIFFVSFTVFFLFVGVTAVANRKWR